MGEHESGPGPDTYESEDPGHLLPQEAWDRVVEQAEATAAALEALNEGR